MNEVDNPSQAPTDEHEPIPYAADMVPPQHDELDTESATVSALRDELVSTKRRALDREKELLAEIRVLQNTVQRSRSSPSPDPFVFRSDELLAESSTRREFPPIIPTSWEDDDEQSMDLATPLEPDSIARTGEAQDARDWDPLLVALPGSPAESVSDLQTSPLLRASAIHERPPTPYSLSARSLSPVHDGAGQSRLGVAEGRLLVLERELEETRKEVAERDVLLVGLQQTINNLRLQMQEAGLKIG